MKEFYWVDEETFEMLIMLESLGCIKEVNEVAMTLSMDGTGIAMRRVRIYEKI